MPKSTRLFIGAALAVAFALSAACVDRSEIGAFGGRAEDEASTDGAALGETGVPDDAGDATPAPITLVPITTPLAAGGLSTCGLAATGGAVCWGDNTHGALGTGSFAPGSSAAPLGVSGLASGVRAVIGGPFAQCAILDDGTARCWGDSLFGDIGGSTSTVQMPTPHDKTGLSNDVARLSFGASFACAVTTSGRGKCWGLGGAGQLGTGSTKDEYVARDIATTEPLVDISASMGGLFACAVTSAGTVLCWGENGDGQLGSHETKAQLMPTAVVGLDRPATSVACGRAHACALLVDGGVACWGSDALGQLGRGAIGAGGPSPPTRINGVASATSLAVGGEHACALAGGSVVCWGANDAAQIATGAAALGPTELAPASFAPVAVTAGFRHTCVMGQKQAIRCVGDGSRKQTGAGDFSL